MKGDPILAVTTGSGIRYRKGQHAEGFVESLRWGDIAGPMSQLDTVIVSMS